MHVGWPELMRVVVIAIMTALAPGAVSAGERPGMGETLLARGEAQPLPVLAERANEALSLLASEVVALDIEAEPGAALSIVIPVAAVPLTLDLWPHSVRSALYDLVTQLPDGSYESLEPGPIRTLRGVVRDAEGSVVAGSLNHDGLTARVNFADGREYWIEPLGQRVAGASIEHHLVYRRGDVIPGEWTCAAADARRHDLRMGSAPSASGMACGGSLCLAEFAADADFEYFENYGSVAAVEARINAVVNAVNVQFERDVEITHEITTIIVRTFEPDPYTSTDPDVLLSQFRSQWLVNHQDIPHDLAELFTGKNLDGNVIGIAWLWGVCRNVRYSLVQSDFSNTFQCVTDLSAHEMGHNWGAGHCTCSGWTMNSSITCANRFHATSTVPDIVSFRDSRTCLEGSADCQTNDECSDGVACTDDLCADGECFNTPNDTNCDNGLFCDGGETCDPELDCQSGADPCAGTDRVCNEGDDRCCLLIHVDADATGTANGTSWTDAHVDLQSALDDAAADVPANFPCARIWVAAGTYYPSAASAGARTETFLLQNNVAIYGGFAGGETSRTQRVPINLNNPTFLNGDLGNPDPDDTDNAFHVVTAFGVDRTAVLNGFFVFQGRATGAGVVDRMGGGMLIVDASPTVTNTVFLGNAALNVGGAVLIAGIDTTPSPAFTNCVFMFNWTAFGGGIFNFNGSPALTNSVFWQNWANFGGAAMWSTSPTSRPNFTNCSVVANHSVESAQIAGGIYIDSGSVVVANSILWFNESAMGTTEEQQIFGALAVDVSHSNIQGLTVLIGNNNIGDDPNFVDYLGGELRLLAGSPSIGTGDAATLPADVADLDQDDDLSEQLPLDFDLLPRVSGSVDMGSYESAFPDP